jgi:hypothetical protein
MSSTEMAIIRRAREIISEPDSWTQGESARNRSGEGVGAADYAACRWCAWGALYKAAYEMDLPGETYKRADAAADLLPPAWEGFFDLVVINDTLGHAAVLSLFDKALAAEAAP